MHIYITDKTGRRFWNTDISAGYCVGERHNMLRRLEGIKSGDPAFAFVDRESAQYMEERDANEMTDDDLLDALLK